MTRRDVEMEYMQQIIITKAMTCLDGRNRAQEVGDMMMVNRTDDHPRGHRIIKQAYARSTGTSVRLPDLVGRVPCRLNILRSTASTDRARGGIRQYRYMNQSTIL